MIHLSWINEVNKKATHLEWPVNNVSSIDDKGTINKNSDNFILFNFPVQSG